MRQGIENLYHGLAGVEGVKVYAGNMSLQKTLDLVNRPGSSDTSDLSIALSGIYCLQELSGKTAARGDLCGPMEGFAEVRGIRPGMMGTVIPEIRQRSTKSK
jgi:hypothetical protein